MNRPTLRHLNWKKYAEVIGLVLALAALVVGIIHVAEIRKTARDLEVVQTSLSTDLRKVQESLSTQFVGTFPTFIEDVIDIIVKAKGDIVILCDYPAYAEYSEPGLSSNLRHAIEQQIQSGRKVQLICLNAERRENALRQQFDRQAFDRAMTIANERRRILRYLGVQNPAAAVDYDMFVAAIAARDTIALTQTFRNAEILQVDAEIPIFFWTDSHRAVMAVQTFRGQDEYGFKTSDRALVNALLATRDRYHGEAKAANRR